MQSEVNPSLLVEGSASYLAVLSGTSLAEAVHVAGSSTVVGGHVECSALLDVFLVSRKTVVCKREQGKESRLFRMTQKFQRDASRRSAHSMRTLISVLFFLLQQPIRVLP